MDGFDKYIGRVFDKRYRIEKIVGEGGMSIVFKAEDILMNRTVAIKMLKDDIAEDTEAVKRFINESKAVAMLSHKNIVNIYDVSVKGNLKYIVMEFIEGITLKTFLKRKGGKLSWRETLNITEQILRALEHAHSKGIVHRDIKPQNIMLLKNGLIKVADFGIAKLPDTDTLTADDKAIGTVHYISPEQASGKPIDEKSDLYSLGVLMYELCCGQLPFTADTPVSVALKQCNEEPTRPRDIVPDLPEGLEQIILHAMQKDPEKRYQSAKQMLRHITALKENPALKFRFANDTDELPAKTGKKRRKKPSVKKDDKKPGQKKTVRTRGTMVMPIILGVVSAFLIVTIILAFLVFNSLSGQMQPSGKEIVVDNYVGESYSNELVQSLEKLGYNVIKTEGFSAGATAGQIVEQDPKAGTVKKSTDGKKIDITLYVSEGNDYSTMPDLTYMKFNTVKTQYTQYSFNKVMVYSNTIPSGYVVKTNPTAGDSISTGDTITAYVSNGQEVKSNRIPNLVGLDGSAAVQSIRNNNFTVGNITYTESELPKGAVVSQSLMANSEAPAGTVINIVLSYGPPETTEPDTTEPETDEPETDEPETSVPDETGDETGTDTGEETETTTENNGFPHIFG